MTLIVSVDDMVVIGNDHKERKTLQNYLSREFEMNERSRSFEILSWD